MEFVLKLRVKAVTNEELLDDVRRVAQLLGKGTLEGREYKREGRWGTHAVARRFGTWNQALRAAGIPIARRQNVPTSELFSNLERVWRTLGRQPSLAEMVRPLSDVTAATYARRFGSWETALREFVAYMKAVRDGVPPHTALPPGRNAAPRSPSHALRYEVLRRDSFKCQACGRSPATDPGVQLELDHKVPWSKGGLTTPENLMTLCDRCNAGKGATMESGAQSADCGA